MAGACEPVVFGDDKLWVRAVNAVRLWTRSLCCVLS